jgi:hypothetical protein
MGAAMEALVAAEDTATVIPTGTTTMADADMARATTIPMGKPNGVAATATCVESRFFSPILTIIVNYLLTEVEDTATATRTARTDTQAVVAMEEAMATPTAMVAATRCLTSALV